MSQYVRTWWAFDYSAGEILSIHIHDGSAFTFFSLSVTRCTQLSLLFVGHKCIAIWIELSILCESGELWMNFFCISFWLTVRASGTDWTNVGERRLFIIGFIGITLGPAKPIIPVAPGSPGAPGDPGNPGCPASPGCPISPGGPERPSIPGKPVGPIKKPNNSRSTLLIGHTIARCIVLS